MKIQIIKGVVIATSLFLGSTAAHAACSQGSFAGTWEVFITKADSEAISWQSCSLNVAKNGTISSGTCKSYEGIVESVNSDEITTSSDCSVTGAIVIGAETYTISDGQVGRNKFDMSGVGTTSIGLFTFTGVKK
ncbi:MAG: hypothetical protein ACRESK_03005 [Gammaproteobacteria bacterium]